MKKFVYVVTKKKNDRNANPRNTINVYQWVPKLKQWDLVNKKRDQLIDYRGDEQAAIEIIIEAGFMPRKAITETSNNRSGGYLPNGKKVYMTQPVWWLRDQGIVSIQELT